MTEYLKGVELIDIVSLDMDAAPEYINCEYTYDETFPGYGNIVMYQRHVLNLEYHIKKKNERIQQLRHSAKMALAMAQYWKDMYLSKK